uniref:Centromere protein S n=1 Tax=Colobus angolensis palliatus TaxID=336983 RepID=A0A2K5I1D9_COLAP
MSSRSGSLLSTKLRCSSCLPCPLYFEKFKPSEKLQEHDMRKEPQLTLKM